jgi:uncharacterized C2H2 Zn-finger protein
MKMIRCNVCFRLFETMEDYIEHLEPNKGCFGGD